MEARRWGVGGGDGERWMKGGEHGEKGLDGGEERREIERRCREREGARDGKSMKRDGEGRRGRMQDGSQSRTVSGRVRKREACSRWAMHNQPLGVVWACSVESGSSEGCGVGVREDS